MARKKEKNKIGNKKNCKFCGKPYHGNFWRDHLPQCPSRLSSDRQVGSEPFDMFLGLFQIEQFE